MIARFVLLSWALAACKANEPSCSDVSRHVAKMFEPADRYAIEIEGTFLGRCINDDWTVEVRRCITSTTSLADPRNCKSKLRPAQIAALDRDLAAVEKREEGRAMPKACLDLEVLIAVAMDCEAIPKQERERIQKQFALAKAGWATVDNKTLLGPNCSAAIAALKQATGECKPR